MQTHTIHTRTHARTHAHAHACACTHTHTHTHTHTLVCTLKITLKCTEALQESLHNIWTVIYLFHRFRGAVSYRMNEGRYSLKRPLFVQGGRRWLTSYMLCGSVKNHVQYPTLLPAMLNMLGRLPAWVILSVPLLYPIRAPKQPSWCTKKKEPPTKMRMRTLGYRTRMYIVSFVQNAVCSPCHYLEGVKDALSEHSGLVRTVGPCAQTWWSWRCIPSAKAQSASRSQAKLSGPLSLSQSERQDSLFFHTCFDSPIVSTFERNKNVAITH